MSSEHGPGAQNGPQVGSRFSGTAGIGDTNPSRPSTSLQTAAIHVAGITRVIGPLLALTAKQIAKVQQADQRYATVEVHHLDDLSTDALKIG